MHLNTPFPPTRALPFSFDTNTGSLSETAVVSDKHPRKIKTLLIVKDFDF